MKQIIIFLLLLNYVQINSVRAQNYEASNFTVTDLDGNTHTLFDYLDDGKSVLLEFFAPWCGPCIDNHNSGILQEVYNKRGPGTDADDIVIIYIDTDLNTEDIELEIPVNFKAVDFPVVNLTPEEYVQFEEKYSPFLLKWPSTLTICPDRTMHEISIESVPQVISWLIVPKVDAGGTFQSTCYHPNIEASVTDADSSYIHYSWVELLPDSMAGPPPFPNDDLNPEVNKSGIFILSATNTINGCGNMDFAVVNGVNKKQPQLSTIEDTLVANCFGDSLDIFTNGVWGAGIWERSWSVENGAILEIFDTTAHHILVQGGGTYTTTTFDNSNGCSSTISIEVLEPTLLMLDSVEVVNTSQGEENGSIILFPSGGTGEYTALWQTGATGLSLQDLSVGSYQCTITDANGCAYISDTFYIEVGISANDYIFGASIQVNLFPNPTTGPIRISGYLPNNDPCRISIINALGNVVVDDIIKGGKTLNEVLDFSYLPGGLYILKLNQRNTMITSAFILTN